MGDDKFELFKKKVILGINGLNVTLDQLIFNTAQSNALKLTSQIAEKLCLNGLDNNDVVEGMNEINLSAEYMDHITSKNMVDSEHIRERYLMHQIIQKNDTTDLIHIGYVAQAEYNKENISDHEYNIIKSASLSKIVYKILQKVKYDITTAIKTPNDGGLDIAQINNTLKVATGLMNEMPDKELYHFKKAPIESKTLPAALQILHCTNNLYLNIINLMNQ